MKHLIIRLWDRRAIRILTWGLVSVLVLTLFIGGLVSWSGERRWQRVKDELAAEGETLDLRALLPPPVPEERNFGAVEPLRGIALMEDGDRERGAPAEKRRVLEAAHLSLPKELLRYNLALGEKPDLTRVLTELNKSQPALFQGVPDGPPAAMIRQALEMKHPVIKELAAAASERTVSEFVPALRDRPLPRILLSMPTSHFSGVIQIAATLRLHGQACLEAGDATAAAADALAIFRLAEAASREPWLIAYLVGGLLCQEGARLMPMLLAESSLRAEDLDALEDALRRLDFEKGLLFAYRTELVSVINAVEGIEQDRKPADSLLALGTAQGEQPRSAGILNSVVPFGFFTHNKATAAETIWRHLIRPCKMDGIRGGTAAAGELERSLARKRYRPGYLFARIFTPTAAATLPHAGFVETLRRQALIACALERNRRATQSYPQQLSELVPALLSTVPQDVMDGSAMRYARMPEGGFVLWSIAIDQKDDGGISEAGAKLTKKDYQGDWAWRSLKASAK